MPDRRRVAVIGGGVAGLTASYLLARTDDVTLFEADDRLGGHAHTHRIAAADEAELAVDTGFIVCNERTYPLLFRLFRELGVSTQETEMSMSVSCAGCGLAYAGRGPGRSHRAHARRVPGRRPLLRLLHRALRDPAGGRRVVLLARHRVALSGGLPVHLPRPSRAALGDRLAPVAHRDWRQPPLCRDNRQAAEPGPG